MAIKRGSESAKKDSESSHRSKKRASTAVVDENHESEEESTARFWGDSFPPEEARKRWPHRYDQNQPTEIVQAKYHFRAAEVDGEIYVLDEEAYVKVKS